VFIGNRAPIKTTLDLIERDLHPFPDPSPNSATASIRTHPKSRTRRSPRLPTKPLVNAMTPMTPPKKAPSNACESQCWAKFMRAIHLLFFVLPLYVFAARSPHLELVKREGLTAHLKITNSSDQITFLSPYIIVEEFYEKPPCEDCAQGWVATRPQSLGKDVSIRDGESHKFIAVTSFLPTRVTVFSANKASPSKDDFKPIKIELPSIERSAIATKTQSNAITELPKAEKKKKILYNLRMIAAAGDQCLMRHGVKSADITFIARDFPDEMKKILVSIDGEDYSKIVYTPDTILSVETKTLGKINYPEK